MRSPRLVLLNGPPGIGKSTLSRRYVDEHPGALDLDGDRLCQLVGGWREEFGRTHEIVRPLTLAMATTHLGGGHDVVLPQYLGRSSQVARFEQATLAGGGGFVHLVLLDDEDRSVARFTRRGGDDPWHDYVLGYIEQAGGEPSLRAMHAQLLAMMRERTETVVVPSVEDDPDATYAAVLAALAES